MNSYTQRGLGGLFMKLGVPSSAQRQDREQHNAVACGRISQKKINAKDKAENLTNPDFVAVG